MFWDRGAFSGKGLKLCCLDGVSLLEDEGESREELRRGATSSFGGSSKFFCMLLRM